MHLQNNINLFVFIYNYFHNDKNRNKTMIILQMDILKDTKNRKYM